jgi:hypothetical protein
MADKLVAAIDPDSGLCAFYVNGVLVWDFGPNDPFFGPLGIDTTLVGALEALAEPLGFEYESESRHPLSRKYWTDYGWEWDSEWPEKLDDAPKAAEVVYDA